MQCMILIEFQIFISVFILFCFSLFITAIVTYLALFTTSILNPNATSIVATVHLLNKFYDHS